MRETASVYLNYKLPFVPQDLRAGALVMLEELMARISEEVTAKLGFWDHLPWVLCGLYPQDEHTPIIANKALALWDEQDRRNCHRVSWRLLSPDGPLRMMMRITAACGQMPSDLHAEAMQLALIPTAEQRAEEVHAKIHKLIQVRVSDPPTVCARLREEENLHFLSSPMAKTFFAQAWSRYVFRKILSFGRGSEEFIKHAPAVEIQRSVYYCTSRQMFLSDANVTHTVKVWNHRQRPPSLADKPHDQEQMVLAHLKKRLAPGVVFSLTDDMLAVATKNDVSSVRGDPSKLARSMFALAQNTNQTHKDLPEQPAEGLNFLWVVCGNTGRRQLLHSHAHASRTNEVATMAMSFSHFHGDRQGIFCLRHDIITLDLLALIRHVPVQFLFSELALWENGDYADLKVLMPRLGFNTGMHPRTSTALTPLHPQQHLVAANIEKILEALGEDLDTPLYHDITSGNLRAEDGSISLPMDLDEVSDLCRVGVFERAQDDFGDAPMVLNLASGTERRPNTRHRTRGTERSPHATPERTKSRLNAAERNPIQSTDTGRA